MPQLCQNLQMCQQALQLALTAIQVEYGPGSANSPFRLLPAAVDAACSIIKNFEMGRCSRQLLFNCALYELAGSATRKAGSDWSSRGLGQCFLKLEGEPGAELICLELTQLEPDDDDDDSDEGVVSTPAIPPQPGLTTVNVSCGCRTNSPRGWTACGCSQVAAGVRLGGRIRCCDSTRRSCSSGAALARSSALRCAAQLARRRRLRTESQALP